MRPAWPILIGLALAMPARAGAPSRAYERAHDAVTEKLVIYRGFATALLMRATLVDPLFLEAMAAERARLLGPVATDPAALLAEMRLDRADVIEVVFAADSGLEFGKTFGPGERGWTVRLDADGTEQALLSVDRIRDPSPMQRALFPQITLWSELYVARFARTIAEPEVVELHVGSGYGHDTITWERTSRRERKLERALRALRARVAP